MGLQLRLGSSWLSVVVGLIAALPLMVAIAAVEIPGSSPRLRNWLVAHVTTSQPVCLFGLMIALLGMSLAVVRLVKRARPMAAPAFGMTLGAISCLLWLLLILCNWLLPEWD